MKKFYTILVTFILLSLSLTGCNKYIMREDGSRKGILEAILTYNQEKSSDKEYTEEELYKILKESGYGEGVDWASKTDDDPSIPKSMDITSSTESIQKAFCKLYPKVEEPGDLYEKAWWDYIPKDYDLTGDVFLPTDSFAGCEKEYNNSLEQSVLDCYEGYTTGQAHDISNVQMIAKTFIYEEEKNKYRWTANLDMLCDKGKSLGIADFNSKECDRPMKNKDGSLTCPGFMTAYFDTSTVGYDMIGIPQFGGYKFSITVWEVCDKPVGWVNEMTGDGFINEKEVYENMGEWDFYDNVEAMGKSAKVFKPKLPNGVLINTGSAEKLSREQYIYQKITGAGGNLYYYGNGITVDMTFFDGQQGGNYDKALDYCRQICGNK